MSTSEQREKESRWLARKAIRRAVMCLARAEEADDSNGNPKSAASYTSQAMDECKKAQRHYQIAMNEKKKVKREPQHMPILSAEEAEKQKVTCSSCRFFTPYNDGDPDGRCLLEMGTYCSHTRGSQNACNEYIERKGKA
ncbi:MAG: hypothetical protein IKY91_04020 [Akkermansia sp.]|nr:hypothetical protein [Akkermansia sp.]